MLLFLLRTLKENENPILYNTFIHHKSTNSTWWKEVESLISKTGYSTNNLSYIHSNLITSELMDIYKEEFRRGWQIEIFNDARHGPYGNKLRCYRTFKNHFHTEKYLSACNNCTVRQNLARLRLSSHKLEIETGRYTSIKNRVEPVDRICQHCNLNTCEDEEHFMIYCNKYKALRKILFDTLSVSHPIFTSIHDENKFIWLMANEDPLVINLCGVYIINCFLLRNKKA